MNNIDSDNSRELQANALLKQRQQEQKQELQKQEEQKQELQKQEEQNKNYRSRRAKTRITEAGRAKKQESIPRSFKKYIEPELGEFDDNFTWSAMY